MWWWCDDDDIRKKRKTITSCWWAALFSRLLSDSTRGETWYMKWNRLKLWFQSRTAPVQPCCSPRPHCTTAILPLQPTDSHSDVKSYHFQWRPVPKSNLSHSQIQGRDQRATDQVKIEPGTNSKPRMRTKTETRPRIRTINWTRSGQNSTLKPQRSSRYVRQRPAN